MLRKTIDTSHIGALLNKRPSSNTQLLNTYFACSCFWLQFIYRHTIIRSVKTWHLSGGDMLRIKQGKDAWFLEFLFEGII